MKKRKILSLLAFCFVGIVLLSGVFAVQLHQHVSYCDAMEGFLLVASRKIEKKLDFIIIPPLFYP